MNPLSFADIKAYSDLLQIRPTPWEINLLKRLDLVTLSNQKTKPTGEDREPDDEVSIDDAEGVRGVFASLKARAAAVFGKG